MAGSLNTVAVGVQHEGGKVVSVILWTQTGITVAPTTRDENRCVKGVNRRAVGSAEAQVHPARWHGVALFGSDRELHT
jgi:hypothetical protein